MDGPQKQLTVWSAAKLGASLGAKASIGVCIAITPLYFLGLMSPSAHEDLGGANRSILSLVGDLVTGFCVVVFFCAVIAVVAKLLIDFMRSRRRA